MVAPSKLWQVCSCYELCHTWNSSCVGATLDVAKASYRYSFRTYALFYLVSTLIFHRGIPSIKKLILDILRSTNFLAANAIVFMSSICLFRKVLGRFYTGFAFVPATFASGVAISLEQKSRRPTLALYMATLATELICKILISRGVVRPIKYGEVLLFSLSSAVGLYMFRRGDCLKKDSLSALKMFVGTDEIYYEYFPEAARFEEVWADRASRQYTQQPSTLTLIRAKLSKLMLRLNNLPKHNYCSHGSSCLSYVLKATVRKFAVGYGIQAVLNLLRALPKIATRPKLLLMALVRRDNFDLALFLGLFVGLFRSVSCLLRWLRDRDSPIHGLIAGGVAGTSSIFFRSTTISLYFASKVIESLLIKGQERGIVPVIPRAESILYAIATATVLNAGVYEPHNIRPAYWSFLLNLTGSYYGKMNRMLIAHLGTGATKLYPDWPVYADASRLNLIDKDGLCARSLQPPSQGV
ncbi:transmembrane protein 135-like [Asterias rubens]|uniref:transmembrane protein 135-like n=1 Tax=Asterias rubens TaxID=7604 RepID=UPI001454FE15|nr:transmembrane protein 135-like [Asterias rubens]